MTMEEKVTVLAALVGEDAEQSGDQLKAYLLMAGQAIQNMNLIFGLDEATGLLQVPPAF